MKKSIFAIAIGLAALASGCNPAHHPQIDNSPGNQPGKADLVNPQGPAGNPPVAAPPTLETNSQDQGERADLAAGHTLKKPVPPRDQTR